MANNDDRASKKIIRSSIGSIYKDNQDSLGEAWDEAKRSTPDILFKMPVISEDFRQEGKLQHFDKNIVDTISKDQVKHIASLELDASDIKRLQNTLHIKEAEEMLDILLGDAFFNSLSSSAKEQLESFRKERVSELKYEIKDLTNILQEANHLHDFLVLTQKPYIIENAVKSTRYSEYLETMDPLYWLKSSLTSHDKIDIEEVKKVFNIMSPYTAASLISHEDGRTAQKNPLMLSRLSGNKLYKKSLSGLVQQLLADIRFCYQFGMSPLFLIGKSINNEDFNDSLFDHLGQFEDFDKSIDLRFLGHTKISNASIKSEGIVNPVYKLDAWMRNNLRLRNRINRSFDAIDRASLMSAVLSSEVDFSTGVYDAFLFAESNPHLTLINNINRDLGKFATNIRCSKFQDLNLFKGAIRGRIQGVEDIDILKNKEGQTFKLYEKGSSYNDVRNTYADALISLPEIQDRVKVVNSMKKNIIDNAGVIDSVVTFVGKTYGSSRDRRDNNKTWMARKDRSNYPNRLLGKFISYIPREIGSLLQYDREEQPELPPYNIDPEGSIDPEGRLTQEERNSKFLSLVGAYENSYNSRNYKNFKKTNDAVISQLIPIIASYVGSQERADPESLHLRRDIVTILLARDILRKRGQDNPYLEIHPDIIQEITTDLFDPEGGINLTFQTNLGESILSKLSSITLDERFRGDRGIFHLHSAFSSDNMNFYGTPIVSRRHDMSMFSRTTMSSFFKYVTNLGEQDIEKDVYDIILDIVDLIDLHIFGSRENDYRRPTMPDVASLVGNQGQSRANNFQEERGGGLAQRLAEGNPGFNPIAEGDEQEDPERILFGPLRLAGDDAYGNVDPEDPEAAQRVRIFGNELNGGRNLNRARQLPQPQPAPDQRPIPQRNENPGRIIAENREQIRIAVASQIGSFFANKRPNQFVLQDGLTTHAGFDRSMIIAMVVDSLSTILYEAFGPRIKMSNESFGRIGDPELISECILEIYTKAETQLTHPLRPIQSVVFHRTRGEIRSVIVNNSFEQPGGPTIKERVTPHKIFRILSSFGRFVESDLYFSSNDIENGSPKHLNLLRSQTRQLLDSNKPIVSSTGYSPKINEIGVNSKEVVGSLTTENFFRKLVDTSNQLSYEHKAGLKLAIEMERCILGQTRSGLKLATKVEENYNKKVSLMRPVKSSVLSHYENLQSILNALENRRGFWQIGPSQKIYKLVRLFVRDKLESGDRTKSRNYSFFGLNDKLLYEIISKNSLLSRGGKYFKSSETHAKKNPLITVTSKTGRINLFDKRIKFDISNPVNMGALNLRLSEKSLEEIIDDNISSYDEIIDKASVLMVSQAVTLSDLRFENPQDILSVRVSDSPVIRSAIAKKIDDFCIKFIFEKIMEVAITEKSLLLGNQDVMIKDAADLIREFEKESLSMNRILSNLTSIDDASLERIRVKNENLEKTRLLFERKSASYVDQNKIVEPVIVFDNKTLESTIRKPSCLEEEILLSDTVLSSQLMNPFTRNNYIFSDILVKETPSSLENLNLENQVSDMTPDDVIKGDTNLSVYYNQGIAPPNERFDNIILPLKGKYRSLLNKASVDNLYHFFMSDFDG